MKAAPPLDDYRTLMPFIESWERDQADFLAEVLDWELGPASVLDLGCGPGLYLVPFMAWGQRVLGVDADPAAGRLLPPACFLRADLRNPGIELPQSDLVLCIEVGEHLQAEYAETLVGHCARAGKTVFWSAAVPGQGGMHHHNEQPREYWRALFDRHNFGPSPKEPAILAQIAENEACRRVGWLLTGAQVLCRRA